MYLGYALADEDSNPNKHFLLKCCQVLPNDEECDPPRRAGCNEDAISTTAGKQTI